MYLYSDERASDVSVYMCSYCVLVKEILMQSCKAEKKESFPCDTNAHVLIIFKIEKGKAFSLVLTCKGD